MVAQPPALLFVHAFPLDASMWDAQVAALLDDMQVIAPSLPGFGGTDLHRDATLDDYADALVRELDDSGAQRAIVVGLSMGGYVAFAMWRRHRKRIAGLLLADTKAEADADDAKARRTALAQSVRENGSDWLADAPPPLLREKAPQWHLVKQIIRRQPPDAIATASLAMAARPDSRGDLRSIDVPTTVVVGEADAITPLANAKTITDAVKGAELTVIPDAGHLSNLESPVAFTDAIRALVARCR